MKTPTALALFLILFILSIANSQDTFSIVAMDSITGEVGSAGASCVDLFQTSYTEDSFWGQLIPGLGAINTQAQYNETNQANATNRMLLGDTPDEIIEYLVANDVGSQPEIRQYGIVALISGSPETAAHTGSSCFDYKNHVLGPNYSIQGNILLGQEVLDAMEEGFLNEQGDLACKLMAALQGANMVGADARCTLNGTSSLFAFVKVAQASDTMDNPSFLISVRTHENSGIEPIDSLQIKFDSLHNCPTEGVSQNVITNDIFSVFPNPAHNILAIESKIQGEYHIQLMNVWGQAVYTDRFINRKEIDITSIKSGVYFLQIVKENEIYFKKLIIQ